MDDNPNRKRMNDRGCCYPLHQHISLSNWLIQFVVVVSPSPVSQTLVVGPNTLAVVFRILCVSLLSMLKYS